MNFFRKKTRKYPKPESNLIVSPFWKKTLVFTNGGAVIRWNFLKGFTALFFLFKKLSVFTMGNLSGFVYVLILFVCGANIQKNWKPVSL